MLLNVLGGSACCLSFFAFLVGLVFYITRNDSQKTASTRTAPPPKTKSPVQAKPTLPTIGHPMRAKFVNAQIGQNITVNHPQRGPFTGKIIGSIQYAELWQKTNAPSTPWTPTGNTFTAHWLGNFMIYEWQERLYLLDEYEALTDQDIQTSFMPYAKTFAQSNQTAKVSFAWPPASWTIVDIGKFSVSQAEGDGLRLQTNATGRFIHASGADNRALVVEDYQSGNGGQDTAWTGWQIEWKDVEVQ